jgi:hypothetical protein
MSAPDGATWRSGYATVCKTVYTSSILVVASILPPPEIRSNSDPRLFRQSGLLPLCYQSLHRIARELQLSRIGYIPLKQEECPPVLAKHSFRRSSSERTCASMASCNANAPLLDNSAEAFLSRFCFQSRIACLVALWASDVALRYAFMQASAIEQVWHC